MKLTVYLSYLICLVLNKPCYDFSDEEISKISLEIQKHISLNSQNEYFNIVVDAQEFTIQQLNSPQSSLFKQIPRLKSLYKKARNEMREFVKEEFMSQILQKGKNLKQEINQLNCSQDYQEVQNEIHFLRMRIKNNFESFQQNELNTEMSSDDLKENLFSFQKINKKSFQQDFSEKKNFSMDSFEDIQKHYKRVIDLIDLLNSNLEKIKNMDLDLQKQEQISRKQNFQYYQGIQNQKIKNKINSLYNLVKMVQKFSDFDFKYPSLNLNKTVQQEDNYIEKLANSYNDIQLQYDKFKKIINYLRLLINEKFTLNLDFFNVADEFLEKYENFKKNYQQIKILEEELNNVKITLYTFQQINQYQKFFKEIERENFLLKIENSLQKASKLETQFIYRRFKFLKSLPISSFPITLTCLHDNNSFYFGMESFQIKKNDFNLKEQDIYSLYKGVEEAHFKNLMIRDFQLIKTKTGVIKMLPTTLDFWQLNDIYWGTKEDLNIQSNFSPFTAIIEQVKKEYYLLYKDYDTIQLKMASPILPYYRKSFQANSYEDLWNLTFQLSNIDLNMDSFQACFSFQNWPWYQRIILRKKLRMKDVEKCIQKMKEEFENEKLNKKYHFGQSLSMMLEYSDFGLNIDDQLEVILNQKITQEMINKYYIRQNDEYLYQMDLQSLLNVSEINLQIELEENRNYISNVNTYPQNKSENLIQLYYIYF